jgi:hypothetical protein
LIVRWKERFFRTLLATIGNAFFAFCEQGLLQRIPSSSKLDQFIRPVDEYQLTPEFRNGNCCEKMKDSVCILQQFAGHDLQRLVDRLGALRHNAVVSRGTLFNSMTADYPVLARL